ncbi:MAG: lysophospholipid acyltransferase family protein [Rhodothalassiaceae bacterium]
MSVIGTGAAALRTVLEAASRCLTGVTPASALPDLPGPALFIANHRSHLDQLLVRAALPKRLRRTLRPVAGKDYWGRGAVRRVLAERVFQALLISRRPMCRRDHPVARLADALDAGQSLLLFPEGTRNRTAEPLLPFKPGLAHLIKARPHTPVVPVWIENQQLVLPKGACLPVPLLCRVGLGAPLFAHAGEAKRAFLARCQSALLETKEQMA